MWVILILVHCLLTSGSDGQSYPPIYDHGVNLPTNRPLNIAHRGSSGMLPEHTVQAYQLAVDQGADVIECDVCVTRDLRLVCLHESAMSGTTNVADVFPPERMDTKYIDDIDDFVTDYFSVDFTLAELKTISMRQRNSRRDPNHNNLYPITSIDEYIQVAQSAGRPVGLYPETKHPIWVNNLDIIHDNDTTFEQLLVETLSKYGYTERTDPCFIQSFDENSLITVSQLKQLPLVGLYRTTLSDQKLQDLSQHLYGIGISKTAVVTIGSNGYVSSVADFVDRCHATGLRVHPFTFRNEYNYLAWDYGHDPFEEYKHFLEIGVDGMFTDFPATQGRFLNATYI